MAGVNKVILLGNLGKDPEIRNFETSKVASFSLATSEVRVNKKTQEKTTYTEWHNISVWGKLADVAEKYLKKGNQIYLEGKLRTRSWDGNDGTKRYTTEIVADNFTMLGKPNSPEPENSSLPATHQEPAKSAPTKAPEPLQEDDLPF